MDIEQFYDADPRRRSSPEVELGADWHDAHGVRFEINWVQDTGELYLMREPVPDGWATPFGGIHVRHLRDTDVTEQAAMTVAVVATIPTREALASALEGWEAAMAGPDSIRWVVERLRDGGYVTSAPAAPAAG